jgi:hypothetical protein
MLPDTSGLAELAVPILVWALATVEPIAKSTISGSVEIQCRLNVLVFVVIPVLSKKLANT